MAEETRCLERYPTTIETLVEGPLLLTAESRTNYPFIYEELADNEEISLPLATYERGIFTCVNRGAKLSRQIKGGINVYVVNDFMTRAPVVEARNVFQALEVSNYVKENFATLKEVAEATTNHGKILGIETHLVGNDVYVRLKMYCGEAAGHNMVTKAGTELVRYILRKFPELKYGADSGNLCTDKKAAAINAISGRGKKVITDITIPKDICKEVLKTTPEEIESLNVKKNLQGSIAAGSLFSANAHYANIVEAMYIAIGQDMANIVEGSYGITQTKVTNGDLYFTTTQPCLIIGVKGNGKNGESQIRSLETMKCLQKNKVDGYNSQRLAAIIAAATAMGELSLLADLTKSSRLIDAHERFER